MEWNNTRRNGLAADFLKIVARRSYCGCEHINGGTKSLKVKLNVMTIAALTSVDSHVPALGLDKI